MGFVSPYPVKKKQITETVPLGELENSSYILNKKPTLESYRIAELAVTEELSSQENNQTLKQYWIDLGTQLEIEGVPKEKICVVASKLIIEKKAEKLKLTINEVKPSGYFYRVYQENNWTDQSFARNITKKTPKPELTKKKINIRYIDYLKRTKEICDIGIKKFEESPDIEKLLTQKQIEILNHEWNTVLDIAEDCFNEKTKVPLNMQHILLEEAATASSITKAGKTFQILKLKEYDEFEKHITSKQIVKFQQGIIPESLSLFKPDSRDTALFAKFSGIQCNNCKSWRVQDNNGKLTDLHCIDCDNSFTTRTINKCTYCQIPLYKERLIHILKTKRCENCNAENILPEEIINYADPDGKIRNMIQ